MSSYSSDRYDNAKAVVTDMLKGLSDLNDSPHYSLAYLECMLVSWASTNNIVFEEVVRTNDWLAKQSKAQEVSDAKV